MIRQFFPRLCRQAGRIHGSYPVVGYTKLTRSYRTRPMLWDLFRQDHWGWPSRMMQENMNMMRRMLDDKNNPRCFPPWYNHAARPPVNETERAQVQYDNKLFRIQLDMSDYSADEINVKIVDDKIVLTAKREKTADEYGFHSREMTRDFLIPENVDLESIKCQQTPEQELIITGKVKGSENVNERVLNIEREESAQKDDLKRD